jgi:hypothetical protein
MSETVKRTSEVAFVDFRKETTRPIDDQHLIQHAISVDNRFQAAVSTSSGVIRPWKLLFADTCSGLHQHVDFYVGLASSLFNYDIIILLDASDLKLDDQSESIKIPNELASLNSRIKFVVLTDMCGVSWAAGGLVPSGVVYWEGDVEGVSTIGVIADILRDQKVFSGLFATFQSSDSIAWALGTRQVWMGKLSGELTQDSFIEVGKDILGSGRLAQRDFDEWDEPEVLIGKSLVDQVLIHDGRVQTSFNNLGNAIQKLNAAFGVTTRKNLLERVATFPKRQSEIVEKLTTEAPPSISEMTELVTSINASNGFDRQELSDLRRTGIDLRKGSSVGSAASSVENNFVEGILQTTQSSIEDGHSVEQVQLALTDTLLRIKPREQDEINEKWSVLRAECDSALEHVKKTVASPPKGLLCRLGRGIAKQLNRPVIRYVAGFLFLWTMSAGVFEIWGDGDKGGFVPWPSVIRETMHVSAIVLCFILLSLVIIAGLILAHTDSEVRKWGGLHRLDQLDSVFKSLRNELGLIATNDWAWYEPRDRVYKQLTGLQNILDIIAREIDQQFISPFKGIDPEELELHVPNPRVRQDLNSKAQGRAFRFLEDIKAILRIDLAAMVSNSLQYTYQLKAEAGLMSAPRKVEADIRKSITRYVRDSQHFGLLFEHLSISNQAKTQRRDLAKEIWEEPGLVDEAIIDVVLMETPVDVVTFVSANHLRFLSLDATESHELRFYPNHASSRVNTIGNQRGISPVNPIVTDSMSAAGVLRVTPLRPNVIELI